MPLAVFALLGTAEVIWGVVTLARPDAPPVRSALPVVLLPPAAWAALLAAGLGGHGDHVEAAGGPSVTLPPVALALGTLLDLVVAIGAAVLHRTGSEVGAGREGQWARLVGVAVGAAAVAVVTASALASTGLGRAHGH